MRRHVTRSVLGTALAAVLAAGCGGGDAGEAPAGDVPDGFRRIGGAANGLLIAVPESWASMDLAAGEPERLAEQSGLSGPALEQARSSLKGLAASKALYATDPRSAERSRNRFATNLNGFCRPSVGATEQTLIDAARAQLAEVHAEVSEATGVPLGGTRAVRIRYALPLRGVRVRGTQYHVPTGRGTTCVVTLTTDLDGNDALFEQIAGTIRAF
ncbi:hypothetical protein [Microtetraspora niveoalba]|uniref:hypothetical protein n=1 Tax=Microtetraspora niveoalba TaxID=46175 RepID=UPI000A4ECDF0|nr:hypothetical protein [Microtetraspora niveoalba]